MTAQNAGTTDIPTLTANATRIFTTLPPAIMEFGTIFGEAGEELVLADGPVYDAFLGMTPHSLDMTTSARPRHTEELLAQWGSTTWDISEEFGTIGGCRDDLAVEVTIYHTDEYGIGSRKPEMTFDGTLESDLTYRDFTINAITICLPQIALVDPCGGLVDLADDSLRTPVSAEQSFDDGPLHTMRTARSSAQLDLSVSMDIVNAMETTASRLGIVSAERIRARLERLVTSPYPHRGIELVVHTGVADIVLPEVAGLVSTMDEHKHRKDVYEHTLTVVKRAMDLETGPDSAMSASDFILRFAALMHDVGKPATRHFEPNGTASFHHHEIVSAKVTRRRMRVLHFDEATIKAVSNLVALHLHFHDYGETAQSNSAVRRYVADTGDLLKRLHRLTHTDCATRNRRKANCLSAAYDDLETRTTALHEQEELDAIRPGLDGDQIMETLELRPSRAVKIVRDYLLELRIEREPLGREAAHQTLLDWWASDDVRAPAEEYQAQQAHQETKVAEKKTRKAAAEAAREAQGQ